MNRRDSLKTLGIASLSVSALMTGCDVPSTDKISTPETPDAKELYGRTPDEALLDARLMKEKFFTAEEMLLLTLLCDIIIPADEHSGSASQAGVPDFIEFTVKDQPGYQHPLRGGLRWLELRSIKLNGKSFAQSGQAAQKALIEQIAYPWNAKPEDSQGVAFFTVLRNLTATGFFTSKIGIDDLQYKGNTPNFWDGVPDDVLKQYGLEYDEKILEQCLKAEDKGKMMVWES